MSFILAADVLDLPMNPHYIDEWPDYLAANGYQYGFDHVCDYGFARSRSPNYQEMRAELVEAFAGREMSNWTFFFNSTGIRLHFANEYDAVYARLILS